MSDETDASLASDARFHFMQFTMARNKLEERGCVIKFTCDKQTGAYNAIIIEKIVTL